MIHEYLQIVTDPAHTMAEITYDLLVWFVLSFLVKKWIRREHTTIDDEHGVEHPTGVDEEEELEDEFMSFLNTEEGKNYIADMQL